jgi:hypothetical protein
MTDLLQENEKKVHSIVPELEFDGTEEEEYIAALEEIKRDVTNHLITPILRCLLTTNLANEAEVTQILMPHLIRCSHCRCVLSQTIDLQGLSKDHFAVKLLRDAEEWSKWQTSATFGTEFAQQAHLAAGIGYAYERDGVIYRRLPSGQEVVVDGVETSVS